MKRVWLWIVGAASAVAGVVLLVLTGERRPPVLLPPPDDDGDRPLVTLRPLDARAPAAPSQPADAVITRIDTRSERP